MEFNVSKAVSMAAIAHEGQVDKAGEPYILHPMRVACNFTDTLTVIVAILHDVVEDTSVTLDDIEETFGDNVRHSVDALTRKEGQDYFEYIKHITTFPQAYHLVDIKLADLRDNMNILRLPSLTTPDMKRLHKYRKAYTILLRSTP